MSEGHLQNERGPYEEVALQSADLRLQHEGQLVERGEAELLLEQDEESAKSEELDRSKREDANQRRLELREGQRRCVGVVRRSRQMKENSEVECVERRQHEFDVLGHQNVLGVEQRLQFVLNELIRRLGL